MTVRDLVKGSLRLLGILASGEEPSAAEAQDALSSLNSMIASWKAERLLAWVVEPQRFAFVANKGSYTMGPGGDWATGRPQRVEKVQLQYASGGVTIPINLNIELVNLDQYQSLIVPQTASPIPQYCYVAYGYPAITLNFYTVPDVVNNVDIFVWKTLDSFPDINASVEFPDGYYEALRFNLARRIASEYGTSPSAEVVQTSIESKASIKRINMQPSLMSVDDALISPSQGGFNYLTGGYGPSGSN